MIKKKRSINGSSECIKDHSKPEGQKSPCEPFKTSNLIATVVRDALCTVIAGKSQKSVLVEERIQHVVVATLEIDHIAKYLMSGLFGRLSLT